MTGSVFSQDRPLPQPYRVKKSGEVAAPSTPVEPSVSASAESSVVIPSAPAPEGGAYSAAEIQQILQVSPKSLKSMPLGPPEQHFDWIREIPAEVVKTESQPEPQVPYLNHEVFSEILKKYVNKSGWFDYRKLRAEKDDVAALHAYVTDVVALNPSTLVDPKDRLAAWLNLYNALVIEELLKQREVNTLLKLPKFFSEKRYLIGEKKYSLMDLEDEVFRKELQEPRSIFARVNGASSGPKLGKEAFDARKIDQQLEAKVYEFLTDTQNVRFDPKRRILTLNPIFLWYEEDFVDLRAFLSTYLNLLPKYFQVAFAGYDWKLNDSRLH